MTRLFTSLTNRIFVACTGLATLALGLALAFVNARLSTEVEQELRKDLTAAVTLLDQRQANVTDTFTRMARLVADLPKLKASVETGDAATVQPLADEYQQEVDADVLLLSAPDGRILASSGEGAEILAQWIGTAGLEETSTLVPHERGLLRLLSVPITIGDNPVGLLGRLTVGYVLDDGRAAQLKAVTGSDIAFAANGRILAASLPASSRGELAALVSQPGEHEVVLDGERFVVATRPMAAASESVGAPTTLVLHSRADRLRFLDTVRTGLATALLAAVLLSTVFAYLVARTVTRPLAAVTSAMKDVAATGDLSRRVAVPSRVWDDEDARLLGRAFNALTESIARFQREAAQRERLSSLGRLSTVIAHEIRNPLMIIRASLAALRAAAATDDAREAVADIDEETRRLNQLVSEVLDFAKPVRFDLAEASLNDICQASATAAWAGTLPPEVELALDPHLPLALTDAERLRTALVNVLGNARQAVESAGGSEPRVVVTTEHAGPRAVITVADTGPGITAAELPHVFDPYFTTKRTGTGLGLPIAKNIIEGLGGTILIHSAPQTGTRVRIDLPLRAAEAAA